MSRSKAKRARTVNELQRQRVGLMNQHEMFKWKWMRLIDKILMNRIEWTGLPETVDARWLERVLTREGQAIFWDGSKSATPAFKDVKLDSIFMATKVVFQGPRDVYDNFNEYRAIGTNFNHDVPQGEGVVIWNSMTRMNDWPILEQFAEDLAEIDDLAKVNRRQQRWTKLLTAHESGINDAERVLRSLDMGEPAILTTPELRDNVAVSTLDFSVPYLQEDFHQDREAVLSELYSYLGLVNVGREKTTYMNYGETEITNDAVARAREDLLSPRRQAAEEINRKWGLSVSVEWKEDEFDAIKGDGPREEARDEEVSEDE